MAIQPRTYTAHGVEGSDQLTVGGANRRRSLAWGLFFGIIAVGGAGRAITSHNLSDLAIDLVVVGTLCVFYLQRALIGRTLIVIDA